MFTHLQIQGIKRLKCERGGEERGRPPGKVSAATRGRGPSGPFNNLIEFLRMNDLSLNY